MTGLQRESERRDGYAAAAGGAAELALAARPPAGPGPRGCSWLQRAVGGRLRLLLAIILLGGWLHLSPGNLPPPAPVPPPPSPPPAAAPPPAAPRRSVHQPADPGKKERTATKGPAGWRLAPRAPPQGQAEGDLEEREAGASCPVPWEPGKGLEKGPRTGPCRDVADQPGCCYPEQGRVRGGRGTGWVWGQGILEGLLGRPHFRRTQSRKEARGGPGRTPRTSGMPSTGSNTPGSEASAVPATGPDGGSVGRGGHRTGRQTDRKPGFISLQCMGTGPGEEWSPSSQPGLPCPMGPPKGPRGL